MVFLIKMKWYRIEIEVTQDGEPVDDANDVDIEIRFADSDEGAFIKADHQGEGLYSIAHTFKEEGLYEVQSHVTARGMHVMPVESIEVNQ